MKCYETEHYIFNYEEGSLAKKDMQKAEACPEKKNCINTFLTGRIWSFVFVKSFFLIR